MSPRQLQAWRFVAEGKTDKECAKATNISLGAFKAHKAIAQARLGVSNRHAMIARWYQSQHVRLAA